MSAPWICGFVVLLLALGVPVTFGIIGEERRRRWERDAAPDWWSRPISRTAVEQSVRPIEAAPPAEMAEVNDPRIIPITRAKKWPKVAKQGGAA